MLRRGNYRVDRMIKEKEKKRKNYGFDFFTNKINILTISIYQQKKIKLTNIISYNKKMKTINKNHSITTYISTPSSPSPFIAHQPFARA